MIPHGKVELVFAGIEATSGAIDKPLQVAIILIVIVTTFIAPPFSRTAFDRFRPAIDVLPRLE